MSQSSTKPIRVPVTIRALLQRINRKLRDEDQMIRRARWSTQLGHYYAIDLRRNFVTAQHVDPEKWGREMGVLREWEELNYEKQQ